jgi:hypothetical protein
MQLLITDIANNPAQSVPFRFTAESMIRNSSLFRMISNSFIHAANANGTAMRMSMRASAKSMALTRPKE